MGCNHAALTDGVYMRTKYVLVEREDFHPMAMTSQVAMEVNEITPIKLQKPITIAEIRQKRIRIWTAEDQKGFVEHEKEREAFEAFRAKYHKKTFPAVIDWFNKDRGQGMLTIQGTEIRLVIYACNIKGRKTWYPETACVYYEKGQIVDIEVDASCYRSVFALGVTPGHFDSEGWDRIKDKNLAFRCDENGEATNGLFA